MDESAVLEAAYFGWEKRGLTPITVYLLMKKYGWNEAEIDHTLIDWIGDDYMNIRQMEWVRRLEAHGAPLTEECTYVELLDVLDQLIAYEAMRGG